MVFQTVEVVSTWDSPCTDSAAPTDTYSRTGLPRFTGGALVSWRTLVGRIMCKYFKSNVMFALGIYLLKTV